MLVCVHSLLFDHPAKTPSRIIFNDGGLEEPTQPRRLFLQRYVVFVMKFSFCRLEHMPDLLASSADFFYRISEHGDGKSSGSGPMLEVPKGSCHEDLSDATL